MGGQPAKKRSLDSQARLKSLRPAKKQRKQRQYHSDSEDEAPQTGGDADFKAVNLLDSDNEDLDNAVVDDGASDSGSGNDSDSSSAPASSRKTKQPTPKKSKKPQSTTQTARDAPLESSSDDDDDEDSDEDDGSGNPNRIKLSSKSKRNDPTAFATSLSKILSTKLSTTRRADPVLARSAQAQQSARDAVDQALENKARRRLREQKRLAMEKGRVRDVLVASTATGLVTAPENADEIDVVGMETTAQIMATEKRLRKVAQRGVVKLFNAVRAAQVKAAEAERTARAQGVIGMGRREEKVAEMSKKGFLDLIAAGGGGLKKGPLEEA